LLLNVLLAAQVFRLNKGIANAPGLMSNFSSIETDQWHCLCDDTKNDSTVSIPSASKLLDHLFFPLFKGIPKKNITEIVGLPGTGKTCFA